MPASGGRVSEGRVYAQNHVKLDEGGALSPGTQVCPTSSQADALADVLRSKNVGAAVSIGCGEGACEAMLEARGFDVRAVDVDVLSDPSRYATMRCFCKQIHRVRPDELFAIPEALVDSAALCFVWGRVLPWRAYLERYPRIPLVVIAGEPTPEGAMDCATEPRGGALDGDPNWRVCFRSGVRAVHGGATLTVYERAAAGHSESSVELRVGARVRIDGLARRSDLNGSEGTVLLHSGGRCAVRVRASGEAVLIKPVNLSVCPGLWAGLDENADLLASCEPRSGSNHERASLPPLPLAHLAFDPSRGQACCRHSTLPACARGGRPMAGCARCVPPS